jgi:hypothetical protein
MNRRIRPRLALPLAALALCAGLAASASPQRGSGGNGQGTQNARPPQQRSPQQQHQGQTARPTPREKQAAQEHHQERRSSAAASGGVRPYQVRAGHLRERLAANGTPAELERGMLGEVNVNRDRHARIERLRRIYEARKDERQLRRLDQLEQSETRRYQGLMSQARSRLSDEQYDRFLDRAGDARLADQMQESPARPGNQPEEKR